MELLDEGAHRVLAYLKALNDGGYSPRRWELEAYAKLWRRRVEPSFPAWRTLSAAIHLSTSSTILATDTEGLIDYLERLGCIWVEEVKDDPDGRAMDLCEISPLAVALLPALDRQDVVTDENDVVEVLTAGDEFALSRVMSRIGAAGSGAMVADPYLRVEDVLQLAATTGVTRILVGERGKTDHPEIRAALPAVTVDRVVEVRVAGRELHDRCLIPTDGPVTVIGGSLNGAGSNVTIMTTITDNEGAVRKEYEKLWKRAEVLAHSKDPLGGEDEAESA